MADELHDSEVAAYATGRWPVVVRMFVLLGAPPRHAALLATDAVAGLLHACDLDQWVDLDATLAGEVVEVWEHDRTPWWRRPELRVDLELDGTGVPEALDVLDALTPDERARLVVGAAGGLSAEQVDSVLGPGPSSRIAAGWSDDLARLAEAIPVARVDEHWLEDAQARSVRRRREGRTPALVGLAAGFVAVAAVVLFGLRAIDPRPGPDPSAASTRTAAEDRGTRDSAEQPVVLADDRALPVAWYDGRRVHLEDRTVRVPRVASMVRMDDGVVVTDERGRILHVRSGGTTESLGWTAPGGRAHGAGRLVSWVDDRSGVLVVQRLGQPPRTVTLGEGARLVAVDRLRVYAESADGSVVVAARTLAVRPGPPELLDVAGPVRVVARDGGLAVLAGRSDLDLVGESGRLSDDGRYLAIGRPEERRLRLGRVHDLAERVDVRVPLPAGSIVFDAVFGDDDVLVVVLRRQPDPLPEGMIKDSDPRDGYDLVSCVLGSGRCTLGASTYEVDGPPLLAR